MGNMCVDLKNAYINEAIAFGEAQLRYLTFKKKLYKNKISTVWLAKNEKSKTLCAVKVTKKLKALQKKFINHTINELDILQRVNHPLLVNSIEAFQDLQNLYIVLQYMPYGNLRDYLCCYTNLTQSQTRFVIICLLISIEYLHQQQIAHLDIKPENLLIDETGYFRLCDFNLSVDFKKVTKKTMLKGIGTIGYQAPQINQNQLSVGLQSDFYSIGVMCVEMLTGFKRRSSQIFQPYQLKEMIRNNPKLSSNAINFVQRLLELNPFNRIGANKNFQQIWSHPWINIDQTQKYEYIQKLIPSFVHDEYRKNFTQQGKQKQLSSNSSEKEDEDQVMIKVSLQNAQFQRLFSKFRSV